MSLEVDEKLFGVMRFLLAAVKSLPDTNRDIFTVECLADQAFGFQSGFASVPCISSADTKAV